MFTSWMIILMVIGVNGGVEIEKIPMTNESDCKAIAELLSAADDPRNTVIATCIYGVRPETK